MAGRWRQDPWRRNEARWFNGASWTERVRNSGVESTDPPTIAGKSRPVKHPTPSSGNLPGRGDFAPPQATTPLRPPGAFPPVGSSTLTSAAGHGLFHWVAYKVAFVLIVLLLLPVVAYLAFAYLWTASDDEYREQMKVQVCAEFELYLRAGEITTWMSFQLDADRLAQNSEFAESARIVAHPEQVDSRVLKYAAGVFRFECGLSANWPSNSDGVDLEAEAKRITTS